SFQAFLRELDTEWAIAWRQRPWLSGRDLITPPDWALVYWDDVSELWLRRDVPRYAPLIAAFEYRRFRPHAPLLAALQSASRAEATETLHEIDRYGANDPPALIARCAALSRLGAGEAAQACSTSLPPQMAGVLAKARAIQAAP